MALRWILRSCPDLLWNLVQKLLRLRHVLVSPTSQLLQKMLRDWVSYIVNVIQVRREKCLLSCNGGELQRSDELKRVILILPSFDWGQELFLRSWCYLMAAKEPLKVGDIICRQWCAAACLERKLSLKGRRAQIRLQFGVIQGIEFSELLVCF